MNATITQPSENLIHFRQWKSEGYSLFQVVGRAVRIAVLAIVYLLVAEPAEAQKEVRKITELGESDVTLEEVEVKGQRISTGLAELARFVTVITKKEIARSPQSSIQDFLDQELSLDVRQRGPNGVQTDISMKGSTYEQVLILINGIPFNDPQTGHFNGDIPIPLSAVERIEIIDGGASRWLGPNAYAGAINIITLPQHNQISASLHGGSFGLFEAGLMRSKKRSEANTSKLAVSYLQTNGYIDNTDLQAWNGHWVSQGKVKNADLHAQLSIGGKKFGAQAFYTPKYPNQYEEVFSSLASIGWAKKGKTNLSQDMYWKLHSDEFHLFRESGPSWYSGPNEHMSQVLGVINTAWWDQEWGKTSIGLDLKHENVWSTVLGKPVEEGIEPIINTNQAFDHFAKRNSLSAYGEQSYLGKKLTVVGGLMGHLSIHEDAKFSLYPGIDAKYYLGKRTSAQFTINRSMRLPSFTELYYQSPTNQGNPDLLAEKAWMYQGGIRWNGRSLSFQSNLFARFSQNNIDWTKRPDDPKWVTQNITQLTTVGFEVRGKWKPEFNGFVANPTLRFGYRFGYISMKDPLFDSRYVLDYLQHKATFSAQFNVSKKFSLILDNRFQDRAGWFTNWTEDGMAYSQDYIPFYLLDIKLSYALRWGKIVGMVNNALNQEYMDIGHLYQPGRWYRFGLEIEL